MPQDGRIPDDLALWELHAYCLGAVQPPGPVVRRDGNGRLLYAARDGLSSSDSADERHVDELERFGLIERTGKRINTTFPVIAPEAALALRRRARELVRECLPRIAAPVARIQEILIDCRLSGHAHAIIFGHALDGAVWTILAGRDAVPDTRPTALRPFWNGTFWAIWPPRAVPAGVNERRFPGMTLVMVWTPATEPRLKELAGRPGLEATLRAIASGAPPPVPEPLLLDDEGRSRLPVIRPGDPLHVQALAIARPVAETLLTEPLPSIEGVTDPRDARIIFGHELIWEISDLLRETGHFSGPADDDPVHNIFLRLDPI